MSAASPTRSTKLTAGGHPATTIPPGLPWPAGDTLTQNTPLHHKHGGKRQVNPKVT